MTPYNNEHPGSTRVSCNGGGSENNSILLERGNFLWYFALRLCCEINITNLTPATFSLPCSSHSKFERLDLLSSASPSRSPRYWLKPPYTLALYSSLSYPRSSQPPNPAQRLAIEGILMNILLGGGGFERSWSFCHRFSLYNLRDLWMISSGHLWLSFPSQWRPGLIIHQGKNLLRPRNCPSYMICSKP